MPELPKIFSSAALKVIASVSMLIDHICLVFFSSSSTAILVRLTVGRIAMPLYVFLMCEGFFYTRNRRRYALNILITALISEPIYDLSLYGFIWIPYGQNVCFTLFCGFLMLCALNALSIKKRQILHLPVIAAFCFATFFLGFSYDYSAMLTFAVFYYLHWHRHHVQGIAGSASIAIFENTPGALLAAIPISLYSSKRGHIGKPLKYLFYAFYPAHLLILYLIKIFL